MDWDMIFDELTASEKEQIVAMDSLRSHISLVTVKCKKDANGLYIPQGGLTNSMLVNGKFANGLYNRK